MADLTVGANEAASIVGAHEFRVLSSPGNPEYAVPPDIAQQICLLDDGRLFVSQGAKQQPQVLSYIARVRRVFRQTGSDIHLIDSDMETIEKLYQGGVNAQKRPDASEMQKFCSMLFKEAVKASASDIHLRIERGRTRVLFRILGDLVEKKLHEKTVEYGQSLIRTLYVSMSDESDSTYKEREKQDAVINDTAKLPPGVSGVRIARAPTNVGEAMTLRLIYDAIDTMGGLAALGYNERQMEAIDIMMAKSTGINFISGPTGSGKSTTLQRALAQVYDQSAGRKNIITVEDPTEYVIRGAVQTSVTNANSDVERSQQYVAAIRSAMRMDPDVIMISEVRDAASARAAVQASMTGHQVYTTVHANSALHIFDRMIDLGVDLSLLTDETLVTGLMAQRLIKVLCPSCKVALQEAVQRNLPIGRRQLDRILKTIRIESGQAGVFVKGEGCPRCNSSGYAGRTAVAEVIVPDSTFMDHIRKRDKRGAETYWRERLAGVSMLGHAIEKIAAGLVDPRDVESQLGYLTDERSRADMLKVA